MSPYGPSPPPGPSQHPSAYSPPPQRYYDQSRTRGPDDDFVPEVNTSRCAPVGYMRQGEQVEVRIRGNVWIVGLLVSSLHLISSYLGQGYDVEYKDQRGQPFRSQFREEDVRPFPR